MATKSASFGGNNNTWADQWDTHGDNQQNQGYYTDNNESARRSFDGGSRSAKYTRKFGDGFGKTKEVAFSGMNKAKTGASASFRWIKQKCNKGDQREPGTYSDHGEYSGSRTERCKEVAARGLEKAKFGASASFSWVKQKCSKN